jgi:hypothetical protein
MTIKQFISDVMNDLRTQNIDDFISPKFIYYKSTDIISDFMKKDNTVNRRLTRLSEGWKSIECLDMEEVPLIECCEVDALSCEKLMKSKYAIPNTFTSSFGNIIEFVSSPNLGSFYDPTTPRVWQTIQKRKDKDKKKKYYFIIDNFLYIPIPKGELGTPESIRLKAWFIEPWKAEDLNAQLQCKDNYCTDIYGSQMPVPEYMRNSVTVELLNQLRQIYLQVRPDNYPNLNTEDKTNQRDLSNGK